jgi:hypothetical protein
VTSCYLFNRIPGVWSKWTLAVFATSLKDAREYMRAHHKGGVYVGEVKSGKVQADCGATTALAQAAISAKNRQEALT